MRGREVEEGGNYEDIVEEEEEEEEEEDDDSDSDDFFDMNYYSFEERGKGGDAREGEDQGRRDNSDNDMYIKTQAIMAKRKAEKDVSNDDNIKRRKKLVMSHNEILWKSKDEKKNEVSKTRTMFKKKQKIDDDKNDDYDEGEEDEVEECDVCFDKESENDNEKESNEENEGSLSLGNQVMIFIKSEVNNHLKKNMGMKYSW
jgi:hypothetical protein